MFYVLMHKLLDGNLVAYSVKLSPEVGDMSDGESTGTADQGSRQVQALAA
jgi:hypothetical protein